MPTRREADAAACPTCRPLQATCRPLRPSEPPPFLIYLAIPSSSPSLTAAPNNKLQEAMAPKREPAVLPHALRVPGLTKLTGKRVVLASASPRRREILRTFVSERAAVFRP